MICGHESGVDEPHRWALNQETGDRKRSVLHAYLHLKLKNRQNKLSLQPSGGKKAGWGGDGWAGPRGLLGSGDVLWPVPVVPTQVCSCPKTAQSRGVGALGRVCSIASEKLTNTPVVSEPGRVPRSRTL